jgi:hypothetical protein
VADGPAPAPEQLAHFCAVAEIQQLAYRYALAFDMRDGDGLLALWAPAREAVRLPDMNRATLQRLLSRFFAIGPSVLLVGNVVVDIDDDLHARGHVYCWAQLEQDGKMIDQTVIYRDAYVRIEGNWLFQTRRHMLVYGQARSQNPYDQPAARWPRSQIGTGIAAEELRSGRATMPVKMIP